MSGGDWIEHDGGKCPVAPDTIVETRARDGHTSTGPASNAATLWQHMPDLYPEWDIIAYRVVPQ